MNSNSDWTRANDDLIAPWMRCEGITLLNVDGPHLNTRREAKNPWSWHAYRPTVRTDDSIQYVPYACGVAPTLEAAQAAALTWAS